MAKTRVQKEQTVSELSEKLQRAKAVVFADFKGMTMKQISDLRNQLSEVESEFTVTKNSLLKLALKESGFRSQTSDIWTGPTATLFAFDDEITPIKALVKAIKDNSIGKIKAGIFGAEVIDEASIQKLASLPSKNELRAKTVGVLVAPLQGMVGVLQGNLRNLVYALSEIQKQKGGV